MADIVVRHRCFDQWSCWLFPGGSGQDVIQNRLQGPSHQNPKHRITVHPGPAQFIVEKSTDEGSDATSNTKVRALEYSLKVGEECRNMIRGRTGRCIANVGLLGSRLGQMGNAAAKPEAWD